MQTPLCRIRAQIGLQGTRQQQPLQEARQFSTTNRFLLYVRPLFAKVGSRQVISRHELEVNACRADNF